MKNTGRKGAGYGTNDGGSIRIGVRAITGDFFYDEVLGVKLPGECVCR